MGAVGGMVGLAGGDNGTGFSTPSGTNQQQLNTAYDGTQNAMAGQQQLLSALQGQNGLADQTQTYNQLQGVVNGTGANPAQAMLNQSTAANVANQASLMAGQRGAGANAGLMARQAANTGAALQQQAAGQGASMQAQQSLNALNAATGQANTMAGQQINQTNQNVASQQGEQSTLQGANSANNQIQGQLANTSMGQQSQAIGGALNGVSAMLAQGGQVGDAPKSKFGQFLQGAMQPQQQGPIQSGMSNLVQSAGKLMKADGGKVPAMVSPGEVYLKPGAAQAVAQGKANPMAVGEKIPGKPKVSGNSYANDVVPKKLDAGGVVIPNSIMQSKDPVKGAADFVRDVMMKKRKKA